MRGSSISVATRRRRSSCIPLLPLKDVVLFLRKKQGKEMEAVNVCIIKVNKDKDKQAYRAGSSVKG